MGNHFQVLRKVKTMLYKMGSENKKIAQLTFAAAPIGYVLVFYTVSLLASAAWQGFYSFGPGVDALDAIEKFGSSAFSPILYYCLIAQFVFVVITCGTNLLIARKYLDTTKMSLLIPAFCIQSAIIPLFCLVNIVATETGVAGVPHPDWAAVILCHQIMLGFAVTFTFPIMWKVVRSIQTVSKCGYSIWELPRQCAFCKRSLSLKEKRCITCVDVEDNLMMTLPQQMNI